MDTLGRWTGRDAKSARKSLIYDFLNQEYENKNPSKTLINIASLPVLIEKKLNNPFCRRSGFGRASFKPSQPVRRPLPEFCASPQVGGRRTNLSASQRRD
jgi:hypothetical protein